MAVLLCSVLGIGLAGSACSHGGQSVVPTTAARYTGESARAIPVSVFTHATQPLASARSFAAIDTSGAYQASVTTLPSLGATPYGVVYDPDSGNWYILVDSQTTGAWEIVRISKTGTSSIFATLDSGTYDGLAYDRANKTFYVTANSTIATTAPSIQAVGPTGAETLLAGGSSYGSTDGTGGGASFSLPTGITVDATDGAIYLVDNDRIRSVTTGGVVTTFTPAGSIGLPYQTGASGIVWNAVDGNFYVADSAADIVRKVSSAGTMSTLAGQCAPTMFNGCTQAERDGVGNRALFSAPTGIASDSTGTLFVADSGNNAVRRVTLQGNVTTFAGNGVPGEVDGAGLNATFTGPRAIGSGTGNLFVTDSASYSSTGTVREVTLSGAPPPPPSTPISLFDTVSVAAQPASIEWRSGTSPASTVLWYTELTGHLASLATTGVSTEYGRRNTSGSQSPTDVVLGGDGTPWFLDPVDGLIKNRTSTGQVRAFKLDSTNFGDTSMYPDTLAYAPNGNLWISDLASSQVASVTPLGKISYITLPSAYFIPNDIAVAADGTLWFANGGGILHTDALGNLLATHNYPANFVTIGHDGNVWFTQSDAIGKLIPTTGAIELYPIYEPVAGCQYGGCSRGIGAMTAGPGGAYWFAEQSVGEIGRLTPSGDFSEYPILTPHSKPFDVVTGPDGNLWFVDSGAQKIGKLDVTKI